MNGGISISPVKLAALCLLALALGYTVSPKVESIFESLNGAVKHNNLWFQHALEVFTNTNTPASSPNTPPSQVPNAPNQTNEAEVSPPVRAPSQPVVAPYKHFNAYKDIVSFNENSDPFRGVDLVIHRNGESDACSRQRQTPDENGEPLSSLSNALLQAADLLNNGSKSMDKYSKYDLDAILTHALVRGKGKESLLQGQGDSCAPTWDVHEKHYIDKAPHLKGKEYSEMVKFCDMGLDRTVIQLDHKELVRLPEIHGYPCHYHTREGFRITSLEQLATLAREAKTPVGECIKEDAGTCNKSAGGRRELHLYAVQAGRVFIFAPSYVGEIFELPHVKVPQDLPVWLEVISLQPRVFDVFNFFDRRESAAIVDKALKETSESHKIKRSSTGASGYNVNNERTSENGFDTHGKEAQAVKKRCMNVLGFDTYEESLTDGLQVLRYNKTTAYIPHLDWIDDYRKLQEHNFDSAGLGSNRFATILLYMSDLEERGGGETVFSKGWPAGQAEEDRVQFNDAISALRESGEVAGLLRQNSWEEKMVANCRSRLAVRPHSSRAVLFYSQNPDGTPDENSKHGGCPVIDGEKWAANLWVWNAPRGGFPGSPVNQHVVEKNRADGKKTTNTHQEIKASFKNTQSDPNMKHAKLFFQDTFWGKLGFEDPVLYVNTYAGHRWNVKVDDSTVKTFDIDHKKKQDYTI